MKNLYIKNIVILSLSFVLLGFIGLQKDIWKAPEAAKKIVNPTTDKVTSALKGKKLYRSRCAVCHGVKGLGDGPGGKALVPKPESLKTNLIQNQTDGELFWKITNGRNDMIKWGPILTETQRWDLVNYVRTLK
jgi:mono/diheme cytochrome c family protein